jgi:hypothetical protein
MRLGVKNETPVSPFVSLEVLLIIIHHLFFFVSSFFFSVSLSICRPLFLFGAVSAC